METFTLEQASYLAEIIGVITVVISLIYLGLQVKQNTQQMRTYALKEAIVQYVDVLSEAVKDVPNARIFRMGLNDFNAFSRDEKSVFNSKLLLQLAGFDQVLIMYNNGLLSHDEFVAMEGGMIRTMLCPGAQQWWAQYKHVVPELFSSYVDKRTQEERNNIKPFTEDIDWYKCD